MSSICFADTGLVPNLLLRSGCKGISLSSVHCIYRCSAPLFTFLKRGPKQPCHVRACAMRRLQESPELLAFWAVSTLCWSPSRLLQKHRCVLEGTLDLASLSVMRFRVSACPTPCLIMMLQGACALGLFLHLRQQTAMSADIDESILCSVLPEVPEVHTQ